MKKKILIFIAVVLLAIIGIGTYCTLNNNQNKNKNAIDNTKNDNKLDNSNNDSNNNGNNSEKILVAYFSKAGENYGVGTVDVGNTAIMASYIVEYLKSDVFEIVPVNPYPDNYEETKTRSQKETKENARPEIKEKINNWEDYDVIFIGYPIWYGDYPMIINTFLNSYNYEGKTIIPFNTHEGSGNAGTYQKIKSQLTNANVLTNGLALQGKTARTNTGKEETLNWLKELGY